MTEARGLTKGGTSPPSVKTRARRILKRLRTQGPNAPVELSYTTPFELLVATILSAQCTDERVNRVTPAVFATYPGARELARASQAQLEALIKPTGFYRNKAQHLVKCSQVLISQFGGSVPGTMEELTSLPGIGRKTANVLLGACFRVPAIVVDTHVKRVAQRLPLTRNTDPTKIEFDLQAVWPPGLDRRLATDFAPWPLRVPGAETPMCLPACCMKTVSGKEGCCDHVEKHDGFWKKGGNLSRARRGRGSPVGESIDFGKSSSGCPKAGLSGKRN